MAFLSGRQLGRLFFLCLLIAYITPLSGAADWLPINQDELKMTNEPQAPGAPAIILYRQLDQDVVGFTARDTRYVRIKILTEEGRKYGDVEIPFAKQFDEQVRHLKARTIRPDGTVVDFQGEVFEKTLLKHKSLKYQAKTFTLPDVQVGCIIEYSYTVEYSSSLLPYHSDWVLSDELYTKRAKFSLVPEHFQGTYNLRWGWNALPSGTTPPEMHSGLVGLEVSNVPAFHEEDFMPPELELKSRVYFIYSSHNPGDDADKYWNRVSKETYEYIDRATGKKSVLEQAVSQTVATSDAPDVKLQKLYARVQQLRNTTYEERKTEQEQKRSKEKEASHVVDVWKHGYGDRQDLTFLYYALAKTAGFDAHLLITSNRKDYFFSPKSMYGGELDSYLVQIKVNGKDIYCDPGAAFAPFGMVPWYETAVQAMIIGRDAGTWITVPLPQSSASTVRRTANLKLNETGDLEGKVTMKFTGMEAMVRRTEQMHEDEAERKRFLEDQLKRLVPATAEVELINKPDWQSSSPEMEAEFSLKVPGWASATGRRVLVPAGLFSGTEKHVFEHTRREHPIYFEFPFEKIDDVSLELPPGWKVTSLPPPQTEDAKAAIYTLKVENDKEALHVTRTLKVDLLLLDTKYYPTLRNFFQKVRTGDEVQIVLQPGNTVATK